METKYIHIIYLACTVLGLTPFYSFNELKLKFALLNKVWATLCLCYRILLIAAFAIMKYPILKEMYPSSTILYFLELPSNVSYIILPIYMSQTLYYNPTIWASFLKKFLKINAIITVKESLGVHLVFIILLAICINVIEIIMENKLPSLEGNTWLYKVWFFFYMNFEEISWLFIVLLITSIIVNITTKYKYLNRKVIDIIDNWQKNRWYLKEKVDEIVTELHKVKYLHGHLHVLVKEFNVLIGWPVTLIFAYDVIDTLDILNSLIYKQGDIGTMKFEIILITCYTIYLIITCDNATAEGAKFVEICYKLETKFSFSSPIRYELLDLAEHAKHFLPKFTALGLFELNRSTCLKLISTLTTYLIVTIQFHITEESDNQSKH